MVMQKIRKHFTEMLMVTHQREHIDNIEIQNHRALLTYDLYVNLPSPWFTLPLTLYKNGIEEIIEL